MFGQLRAAGRSEAKKKADALAKTGALRVIDEAEYRDLVRIDLTNKRFAFAGGFDCSPGGLEDGVLFAMTQAAGASVAEDVDTTVDYLILGNRRGASKVALQRKAERLQEAGAPITILHEAAFMELVRVEKAKSTLTFPAFLSLLYGNVDEGKLGRAMAMLKAERHKLFSSLDDGRLVGVVKSQGSGSLYASFIKPKGEYGCSQLDLDDCMGLQGSPCKHILVLVIGLARAGELPMQTAIDWIRQTRGKRPRTDEELCAATFVRYKGAEAGELDWRPTETIPEDFYAV